MTDTTELRMNVAALKRVDPYVKDILETATHVAFYTFNSNSYEWEKTDIEGALFVYSRNGEPYNSILIMNRLNTNNLVEPVTQGLDLQLQEPFLLYRTSECNIYGIWFYDKEECLRIGAMLNRLIKDSEETRKTNSQPVVNVKKSRAATTNNVDIFSMLSKAQEDFNTNKSSSGSRGSDGKATVSKSPLAASTAENITGPLAAPLGPDVTSQSVMDFFAKAKVNTGRFKPGDQPTPGGTVANGGKPLLARLMSHPAAHTLEHIEKQQRVVTPQPATQSSQLTLTPVGLVTSNSLPNAANSNRSKRRSKPATQPDSAISTPVAIPQDVQPSSASQNVTDTNGTTGFLRIQSPTNAASSNLTNHQASDIIGSNNSNSLASLFAHASTTPASEDIINAPTLSPTGTGSALPLIPPVMFSAPSRPLQRPLDPLTRQQFYQAFTHLIRTDPDFITKLHEAYIKSFSETLP